MNICIVGDFSDNLDEGFKNIAYYIAEEVSKYHKVTRLNIKNVLNLEFWKTVKNQEVPMIIHYITAPSLTSFIILKTLKMRWRNKPKTIISAVFPNITNISSRFLKPDLILSQSYGSEKMFKGLNFNTQVLPNGVDIDRFIPVSKNIKKKLREKYGIDKEKFVILHVGHIKEDRNLQIFNKIQSKDIQIVIVGSRYIKFSKKIYQNLKKAGCIVLLGYLKNIEEIYALSDCYVFPVKKGCSIIMPLSILEAMSCNLPIVTRRFDGPARFFQDNDDLIFAETKEDFVHSVNKIKCGIKVHTRSRILPFSWKNIGLQLNWIYDDLLKTRA